MNLHGKKVLVTGASSGIGADLARELAGAGADVALTARRVPELEALADELRRAGARVEVLAADLATPAGADELATAATARLGAVDVLVNNAGVHVGGRLWEDGHADQGELLMQVNVLSPLRLAHRLLPEMMRRREGSVVFMSSIAGWTPVPGAAYYAASKAALARAAETLRIELTGSGVHVLAVYPGPIGTPMLDRILSTPLGREVFERLPRGTSPELARRVVDGLLHDEEDVVYPALYRASVWFSGVSRWVMGTMAAARRRAATRRE